MNKLNNITTFEDFKKLYEDIGTEFSNSVGFTESLVGRATFGLINLVRMGINRVLLEYFGRRLENEYLAGVLRYCKKANINLKDPQPPSVIQSQEQGTTSEENEIYLIAQEILKIRFDVPSYEVLLDDTILMIDSGLTQLQNAGLTGSTQEQDFNLIKTKLIPDVKTINDKITILNGLITTNTPPSATNVPDINTIKTTIEDIKTISFTTPPPVTLQYKLTDSEKNVISGLTSTSVTDRAVLDPLEAILVENMKYEISEMITEKVTSGGGTSLTFILGDEISTEGVDQFLKKQGVNNLEEVNWVQLAKIYTDKMKTASTNEVNKDAVIRIQQGVSPKIFHKTPTPKGKGLTPGTGGGVSDQPTALYNPWQKKVQKVKSEFRQFLNVEEVDPFKLKLSDYSGKDDPNKTKLGNEAERTRELERLSAVESNKTKINFHNGFAKAAFSYNMIRVFYSGLFYGPLFRTDKKEADNLKVLKYLGSLNLDTIVADISKGPLETDLSKYETVWEDGSKNGLPFPFLQSLITSNITKGGKDLIGVYFIFEKQIVTTFSGESRKNRPVIIFLYATGKSHTTSISTVNSSVELYAVSPDGKGIGKITDISKLNLIQPVEKFEIGEAFNIANSEFIKGGQFNVITENFKFSLFDIQGVNWK